MLVTLSLFAGVGAQFLDDSGNVLTGGKIYTYYAGTTTPLATYTSNSGNTAHTNPIILNAAGRIATGELWLTTGIGYKFVLKDSNNVLIATYDNVPSSAQPPIANDAAYIAYEQGYTVTAGSFVIGETYLITSIGSTNFQTIGASSNTVGTYFTATGVGSGSGTAELSRTVEVKLQESISVKDFGAVGNGVVDDTVAIQAGINYCLSIGAELTFPVGSYVISSTLQLYGTSFSNGVSLIGEKTGASSAGLVWKGNAPASPVIDVKGLNWSKIRGLQITSSNFALYPYLGCIHIRSGQNTGTIGSSGMELQNLYLLGGIGVGSYGVRIGENNESGPQASEVYCNQVVVVGGQVTEYGWWINATGNVKDMTFSNCSSTQCTIAGVYYSANAIAGWCLWNSCGGGGHACDYLVEGNGTLQVIGGGSENSVKALIQKGAGSNPASTYFYGYHAEKLSAPDTFFIEAGQNGQVNLELRNCFFTFASAVTNYIKFGDAKLQNSGSAPCTIVSTNNFYEYASTIIPVWSYDFIGTKNGVPLPSNVYSEGDTGGPIGALTRLLSVYGTKPQRFDNLATVAGDWYNTRGLSANVYSPALATTVRKFTIDYTYIKDNSTSAVFSVLNIPIQCKIVGVYAVVSTSFTLAASVITMAVGYAAGGFTYDQFLLTKTISGGFTGEVGTADADLGTALARATAVQGGLVNFSPVTTLDVAVLFKSSVGNLGNGTTTSLTTGSVDVYFVIQDLA